MAQDPMRFATFQDVIAPRRVFFEREGREGKLLGYRTSRGVSTDGGFVPRLVSFLTLSLITVINPGSRRRCGEDQVVRICEAGGGVGEEFGDLIERFCAVMSEEQPKVCGARVLISQPPQIQTLANKVIVIDDSGEGIASKGQRPRHRETAVIVQKWKPQS
ncbi:hypothetical protein BDZ45DRAFT_736933 [Acephala macrosclerotiorum]|nr:hypothetical protein BDZ45DRAFT_736933 [Acephala macrosclerotiorum]